MLGQSPWSVWNLQMCWFCRKNWKIQTAFQAVMLTHPGSWGTGEQTSWVSWLILKYWDHIEREGTHSKILGPYCFVVSKGLADRLMRWGNNGANQGGGRGEEDLSMVWQPGFGVSAGLPAGLRATACAGHRSLILGPTAHKGQHAVGRAAFLRTAWKPLVMVFLCVLWESLSAFVCWCMCLFVWVCVCLCSPAKSKLSQVCTSKSLRVPRFF